MIVSQVIVFLVYWIVEGFKIALLLLLVTLLCLIDSYFLCYLMTFLLLIRRPPKPSPEGEARLSYINRDYRPNNEIELRRIES